MPKLVFDEEKLYEIIDRIVKRTFEMDFEWDWPGGVAFYGVAEAYEATKNEEYLRLLKEWIDERLEDGLPKLSVNGVSIGHTLLSLYEATGDDRYLDTAKQMADYVLHEAPRFADGILQHTVNSERHVFPEQAWVDTMMMAGLFLLRIGRLAGNDDYFEDGLRQFHGHEEFLQDMDTNLYYHAWDHQAKHNLSGVFWARGNGWAALTMAKALPLIDVTHPSYMIIDGSLRDLLSALARLQHSSGLWHTVLTDPDSYLEVSGSAGIAAGLLAKGSLYHKYIQKSLSAITEAVREDGRVERVSSGTAVMPDAEGYKDVPFKRIQGWGQGLVLTFLADVVRSKSRVFQ